MRLLVYLFFLFSISGCVFTLCLHPAKQEIAPELQLKEADFNYEEYRDGLKFIEDTLDNYYKGKKPGWEIENIGIPNSLLKLKGYGLFVQKDIARLELENAKLRGASEQDIERLNKSLRDAEHKIKVFLSGNNWMD